MRRFPVRPITNDEELDTSVARINELIDRGELSKDEKDYLSVLGTLVERYEAGFDQIPDTDPVDMLKFLIEQHRLTQAQLSQDTGPAVATISEILNRKRGISDKARKALAKRFNICPSFFA